MINTNDGGGGRGEGGACGVRLQTMGLCRYHVVVGHWSDSNILDCMCLFF